MPYSWKCSRFFSGIKSAQFIIQLWQKASVALNLGIYFRNKVQRMFKKLPLQQNFAPSLSVCAALRNDGSPACTWLPAGLVQNPSEAVSSLSKWTDLAEDCLPWPEHSSPVSQIQIIDFSDARFEERARKEKRKGGGGEKKKTLSEQSRRLPTWSERNSVSDLHISSVRHALSRDLLHLSLTRKCVCIPNGWRRGWATARSDSEGSIRQVWLFLSSLSVWGAAAPVVRWVTQQSAVGSKCCSTAILWLVELEKVFVFFVFSGSYLSTAAITYSSYVCLCALYTCTWSSGSLSGTSGTLTTHAHMHIRTRTYIYCSAHIVRM